VGLGGGDPTDLYLILSTGGFYLESYMGFFGVLPGGSLRILKDSMVGEESSGVNILIHIIIVVFLRIGGLNNDKSNWSVGPCGGGFALPWSKGGIG
jgi:hypothetical protein